MSNGLTGLGSLLAVLLLSVPAPAATTQPAAFPLWTAVAASGDVTTGPPSSAEADWSLVHRGDGLAPHSWLRTGRRGRATLTRGASVVIVDPQSRLELPEQVTNDGGTSIVQSQGSVIYRVDRRSHRHFEVVTPHLVAGVKGTSFLVTVTEHHSSVIVESGSVEVWNPSSGETAELGPGQSLFLDGGEDRFARFDRPELSPRARRENERLLRMNGRDEREMPAQTKDEESPADVVTVDGHDDSQSGWVDAAGDGQAEDWKDDAGTDDTGWEEEALQDHGKGEDEDDGKGEDPTGKEEPEDPQGHGDPGVGEPPAVDEPVPFKPGGGDRLDQN